MVSLKKAKRNAAAQSRQDLIGSMRSESKPGPVAVQDRFRSMVHVEVHDATQERQSEIRDAAALSLSNIHNYLNALGVNLSYGNLKLIVVCDDSVKFAEVEHIAPYAFYMDEKITIKEGYIGDASTIAHEVFHFAQDTRHNLAYFDELHRAYTEAGGMFLEFAYDVLRTDTEPPNRIRMTIGDEIVDHKSLVKKFTESSRDGRALMLESILKARIDENSQDMLDMYKNGALFAIVAFALNEYDVGRTVRMFLELTADEAIAKLSA